MNDMIVNVSNTKKLITTLIFSVLALALICFFFWDTSSTAEKSAKDNHVFPVYITEIMSSNESYPNEYGYCSDYIELYNSADYEIDISGYQLSDNSNSRRYTFPPGSIIQAQEYLLVYCEKNISNNKYASFGISKSGGEKIHFLSSHDVVLDEITTIEAQTNCSMSLLDDGSWSITVPASPGYANSAGSEYSSRYTGISPIRINEIMLYNSDFPDDNGNYYDWIELFNPSSSPVDISGYTLSDNLDTSKYVFPEGTSIPANSYYVVYCETNSTEDSFAQFNLSRIGGETVVLKNSSNLIVDLVFTANTQENQSMIIDPLDPKLWQISSIVTPGFSNDITGYNLYTEVINQGRDSIIISEIMHSNNATLVDKHNDFSDWIELHNVSNTPVNLKGWHLSDNDNISKWEFPSVIIEPDQYLVIFCSGLDQIIDGEIHTNFSLSATGEPLTLTTPRNIVGCQVFYTPTDPDESIVLDEQSGAYTLSSLVTPGYPNDLNGYESFCSSKQVNGPLAIWEVMVSNESYLPQSDGKCYDWVELKNISNETINLSDYSITDDADAPKLYVLPDISLSPGQSTVIILSGNAFMSNNRFNHANFSLNAIYDCLYLYNAKGIVIDYTVLKNIPTEHSFGRNIDSGGFFYMQASPTEENFDGYRLISDEPVSSVSPGVYTSTSSIDVTLSSSGQIYYTLDGSDPSVNSNKYSHPIIIDKTSVLRAIAIEDGKMSSSIYTASFVVNSPHSLPIVSLVTDPDNLWGKNGIYKDSTETKNIKKTANISYSGNDGSFSMDCEISMHGKTSLIAQEKKSFTVRFRNNYDGALNYDIFEDGKVTRFSSIILRADQESTYSSYMRDSLLGYLASTHSSSLLSQNSKHVVLYINGNYWGIYSIREHHSVEHYAAHQNDVVDSVLMHKGYLTKELDAYDILVFCQNNDLSDPENYEFVSSHFDVYSFADWIIFEAYSGNFDIYSNMRYYYSETDKLWRCGLVDLDLGLFRHDCFPAVINSLQHGQIVSALLESPAFQELLLTRLAELLAGPLSDENVITTIDILSSNIRSEIPTEKERWGGSASQWEYMVNDIKDFCDGRALEMVDSICSVLNLSAAERNYYFGGLDL